jgi:hypothetical protein
MPARQEFVIPVGESWMPRAVRDGSRDFYPPNGKSAFDKSLPRYDSMTAATHKSTGDGFILPPKRIAIILCLGAIPVGAILTRKK